MLLLATNVREKTSQSQERRILKAYTLLVICTGVTILHSSRYNFALVLQGALVFSQSMAGNFFMSNKFSTRSVFSHQTWYKNLDVPSQKSLKPTLF